jgi:hypothetical protein
VPHRAGDGEEEGEGGGEGLGDVGPHGVRYMYG